MGFLKRRFKSNPKDNSVIDETTVQSEYPKKQIKVIPISDSDFEYMEWRRKRMYR